MKIQDVNGKVITTVDAIALRSRRHDLHRIASDAWFVVTLLWSRCSTQRVFQFHLDEDIIFKIVKTRRLDKHEKEIKCLTQDLFKLLVQTHLQCNMVSFFTASWWLIFQRTGASALRQQTLEPGNDSGSPNQPGLVSLHLTFQLLETSISCTSFQHKIYTMTYTPFTTCFTTKRPWTAGGHMANHTTFSKLQEKHGVNNDRRPTCANFLNPTSAGEASHGRSSMFTLKPSGQWNWSIFSVEWIPDKSVIQAIPDCWHPPKKMLGFCGTLFGGNIFPPGNPAAWHFRNLKKHPFTAPGGLLPSWGLHWLA